MTTPDRRPRRASSSWASIAVACAACVLAPGVAFGQLWTEWGPAKFRRPVITTRTLPDHVAAVGMTPEQRRSAEELVSAYTTEHATLMARADEVDRYINEVNNDHPEPGEWYHLAYAMRRKLMARLGALHTSLVEDLKVILDPAQLDAAVAIERRLRREHLLRLAERGGTSIAELTELLKAMRPQTAVTAAIAPAVEQYELELDQELQGFAARQERYLQEWDRYIPQYTGNSGQAPEIIKTLAKELSGTGARLTVIRRRHIERIRALVPSEHRVAFDAELNRRLYPAIYKAPKTLQVLDAALALNDLDTATRAALQDLKDTYERDLAAANERLVRATDTRVRQQEAGEDVKESYADERASAAARRALDAKLLERLHAMLTADQLAALRTTRHRPNVDLDSPPAARLE